MAGYLRTTESASRKHVDKRRAPMPDHPEEKRLKISHREGSVLSTTTRSSAVADHEDSTIQLGCLYAYYLQYKQLLYNMDNRFAKVQQIAKKELEMGHEAIEKKEEYMKNKRQEEEAKERTVSQYISKVTKVLDDIDQKISKDEAIDYEKRLLSDFIVELNELEIPASSMHEDKKTLAKCRELMEAIVDS
ncbi:hypothetical protein RMATCC62417_00642 [Rhizopus microsporus]|nr:hypothetical protein RMATCC62417_00642 [Rhizopus microsporus]